MSTRYRFKKFLKQVKITIFSKTSWRCKGNFSQLHDRLQW